MAIPNYQKIMLPLLIALSDEKEHDRKNVVAILGKEFKLTDEELLRLQPSGHIAVFVNRVGWAFTYMKKAGLVKSVKRGIYKISKEGIKILKEKPKEINNEFLSKYQSFVDFQAREKTDDSSSAEIAAKETRTPEEIIDSTYKEINAGLAEDLLEKIKESTPQFFEKLVVEVLVTMGYGGSRENAGQAIGRRGDEGIDGIIKEDKLGLDIIYIQAKKWDNPVGRPEIQKFAGALQGQRARKGIFITTATFTKEARDFVKNINAKIILIDGQELADLMITNNVGVSKINSYEIKRTDTDYFEE